MLIRTLPKVNPNNTLERIADDYYQGEIYIKQGELKAVPETVETSRFIKDNTKLTAEETFLSNKSKYTRTGKKYSGAEIFKNAEGEYFYIDRGHKGLAGEVEYFNKHGEHIGALTPEGKFKPNSLEKGRTIKNLIK